MNLWLNKPKKNKNNIRKKFVLQPVDKPKRLQLRAMLNLEVV